MKYYVEITFNDGTVHNVFATNYYCARDIRNDVEFKDGVRMVYIGDVKPISVSYTHLTLPTMWYV